MLPIGVWKRQLEILQWVKSKFAAQIRVTILGDGESSEPLTTKGRAQIRDGMIYIVGDKEVGLRINSTTALEKTEKVLSYTDVINTSVTLEVVSWI